jgi:hypothetical protein
MDCLAVKQAVKYAKEYTLKNGPFVSSVFIYPHCSDSNLNLHLFV